MNTKQLLIILSAVLFLSTAALVELGEGQGCCASQQNGTGLYESEVVEYTEEQQRRARAACDEMNEMFVTHPGILKGVHDKATADAAAALLSGHYAVWEAIEAEAKEGGWYDLLGDLLYAGNHDPEIHTAVSRVNTEIGRLQTLDPPFYGSEAMRRLFHEAHSSR